MRKLCKRMSPSLLNVPIFAASQFASVQPPANIDGLVDTEASDAYRILFPLAAQLNQV